MIGVSGMSSEHRGPVGRRRANVAGGRQHRHEVKVSAEEEGALLLRAKAQRVTVPRLLVESALSVSGETSSERRQAMTELFSLHRLLATIFNEVNEIAKAMDATGEAHVEIAATLARVRAVAGRIDDAIDGLSVP